MARLDDRNLLRVLVSLALAAFTSLAMIGAAGAAQHHRAKDSDRDGMPNKWARSHDLKMHHRDAKGDPDKDGLVNLGEFHNDTRPHSADSDKDGLEDGAEVHKFDTDPNDPDSDEDGLPDGEDDGNEDGLPDEGEDGDHEGLVGTILHYNAKTGVLTFQTMLGYPLAALVTEDTRIVFGRECEGGEAGVCNLVEGQDIMEMRFGDFEPGDEFPPLRTIILACPPEENP